MTRAVQSDRRPIVAKKFKNIGTHTLHLGSREPGKSYFEFHPGDVVEVEGEESKVLAGRYDVEEVLPAEEKETPKAGKKKG